MSKKIIMAILLPVILSITVSAGRSNQAAGADRTAQKKLVIDYRFDADQGVKIKDYSPFHNDAEVMGAEWAGVVEWKKGGGAVIASMGAHIPGSALITPETFSLELTIKPLQTEKYGEIFTLFVSPFYLKDRTLTWKNKENLFYPVYQIFSAQLIGNNNIRVCATLKDGAGNLVRASFTSKESLATNEYSQVIIAFDGKNLIISINGKQQSFAVNGRLYYDHPELYPGHVNALLGGQSLLEYKDLKLYSLDKLSDGTPKCALKIKTPYYLNFFAQNEPKVIDVGISTFYDAPRDVEVVIKSSDHEGREIFQHRFEAKLKPLRENNFEIVIPNNPRGCFWLDCAVSDDSGTVVKRTAQYSVGAIRDCKDFPESSPFGRCDDGMNKERFADFGEKWTRIEVWWIHIEPENNKFDFSELDKMINHQYRQGLKIYMAFIAWAPEWITGKDNSGYGFMDLNNEEHFKYYERMVREVLARYKGKISGYDVICEANAVACFRDSPEFYLRVLKIFHKAKDEIDPGAFIGGPSAWRGGWDVPTEAFLKLGAGQYWDFLDTHYIGGSGGYYLLPEKSVCGSIGGSREMMAKYNVKLPIMDGETGYVTCGRRAEDGRPMTRDQLLAAISREELFATPFLWEAHLTKYAKTSHDEITAAQFTVRRMILCLSEGAGPHLRHTVGKMTYNSEINPRFLSSFDTGVLLPGIAWTAMIGRLSAAKFIRKIALADKDLYAYLFYDTKSKKRLAVLWSLNNQQTVLIDPDSRKPAICDIWGNPRESHFSGKNLLVELSESPVYMENVGENIALAGELINMTLPEILLPKEPVEIKIAVNNPLEKAITGTLELSVGNDAELDKNHFVVSLKPGEKTQFAAVLTPKENVNDKINIVVKLNSAEYGVLIRNAGVLIKEKPLPITRAVHKIQIDGAGSDWPEGAGKIFLGQQGQVKFGLNSLDIQHRNPDRDWVGPEDLSGDIRLCWDAENIYILADITDPERNILKTGNQIRGVDGFELFLDGRDPWHLANDPYAMDVRHIFISPGVKGSPKVLIRAKGSDADKFAGLIEAASRETAKGYVVELKIPITKEFFPQLTLSEGRVIGFNIYLNDADKLPVTKATIVWHGNLESNEKPSEFGRVILVGEKR